MQKISSLIIAFVVCGCSVNSACAAQKNAPGPFDIERRESVISETHSLDALIESIKKLKLKKDDFETTEQFQSRLAAFRLPGNLPLDATIAIKYKTENISPFCDNKYNADAREITFSCESGPTNIFSDPINGRPLSPWTIGVPNARDTGSYIAKTTWGATIKVTKRVAYGRGLAIDNLIASIPATAANYPRKIKLTLTDISSERARKLIRNIGVVFIADIRSPYFVEYSREDSPSLSDPMEFKGQYDYLFVHVRQMWLVDVKSGEILGRFDDTYKVLQN